MIPATKKNNKDITIKQKRIKKVSETGIIDAQNYYTTLLEKFLILTKDDIVGADTVDSDNLPGYTEIKYAGIKGYFVLTSLVPESKKDYSIFTKSLFYATANKDYRISQFVYLRDKESHLKARGIISPTIVDRLDTFFCGTEMGKFRHFGTKNGSIKYGVEQSEKFRESNKPFLRMLHNGPANISKKINCHFTDRIIEGESRFSYTRNKTIICDEFELHHALFKDATSYYYSISEQKIIKKVKEPSDYLNNKNLNSITTELAFEFLSMIILSCCEHDKHHKIESSDGLDIWLLRYQQNICKSLPYAWINENNYLEVLKWMSENCKQVNINLFPDYKTFILLHSSNTLK